MATHSRILAWRIPRRGAWQATVHGVAKSQTWLSTHTAVALVRIEFKQKGDALEGPHWLLEGMCGVGPWFGMEMMQFRSWFWESWKHIPSYPQWEAWARVFSPIRLPWRGRSNSIKGSSSAIRMAGWLQGDWNQTQSTCSFRKAREPRPASS